MRDERGGGEEMSTYLRERERERKLDRWNASRCLAVLGLDSGQVNRQKYTGIVPSDPSQPWDPDSGQTKDRCRQG